LKLIVASASRFTPGEAQLFLLFGRPVSQSRPKNKDDMMPTKRFAKKYWKMVMVLITLCAALLLLRWAAMLWG